MDKTKNFVNRSFVKHSGKYSYDKTTFINARTKVTITCPEHGDFEQIPDSHLRGVGCAKCYFDSKLIGLTEFIAKAKQMHGNKYIYDKTVYAGSKREVKITCPVHGDFEQKPHHHLQGRGCKLCSYINRTLTNEEFIVKARATHGEKYNYSKTQYTTSASSVLITCPVHGDFAQSPFNHIGGYGCPRCGRLRTIASRKHTETNFIKMCNIIHNNKYDYSETVYTTTKDKVKIICPVHGTFEQTAGHHLSGQGCIECTTITRGLNRRSDTQEFIAKAKLAHGDKYDYTKATYVTDKTPVVITCRAHGDFLKKPSKHLSGQGCVTCSLEAQSKKQSSNTEEFILKAKLVHGERFDYSKVNYVKIGRRVIITCKKHGDFEQTPACHLSGSGCPHCVASKGEIAISSILKKTGMTFQTEFKPPESTTRHRFDFYLPEHRVLIEYHGVQHYKPIEFFGGEEGLKETKFRDAYKRALAKTAGYVYLEFNYKQFKHMTKEAFESLVVRSVLKQKRVLLTGLRKS